MRNYRVGELLEQWASVSRWAQHQFLCIEKVVGPSVHNKACKAAVAQYARCLLTPKAMVELVLNMRSSKNAVLQGDKLPAPPASVHGLIAHFDLDYYVGHLCTCNAFALKWKQLLTALQLEPPTSTTHPRTIVVVWPVNSWTRWLFSRRAFI